MTDNSNTDVAPNKAAANQHLQDKLVEDSITNNQKITAKVKASHNAELLKCRTCQQELLKVNKRLCQITTPTQVSRQHQIKHKH